MGGGAKNPKDFWGYRISAVPMNLRSNIQVEPRDAGSRLVNGRGAKKSDKIFGESQIGFFTRLKSSIQVCDKRDRDFWAGGLGHDAALSILSWQRWSSSEKGSL